MRYKTILAGLLLAAGLSGGIWWGKVSWAAKEQEAGTPPSAPVSKLPVEKQTAVPAPSETRIRLKMGESVQISARVAKPSQLPDNARLRARWTLIEADDPNQVPRAPENESESARPIDALGISTPPTPNWSKILHALDADVFVIYRAPVAGVYALRIEPEEGEIDLFDSNRWREAGSAPELSPVPRAVPWPTDRQVDVSLSLNPIEISFDPEARIVVETEPNDTPEQAQRVPIGDTDDEQVIHILGGSDDIEYFDNGYVGQSGDDWYRFEYRGSEPRLLTACLSIPDQQVAARIRAYELPLDQADAEPGQLLPITNEYEEGKNPNERVHQQDEQHRIAINRTVKPGHAYFLRVEANSPGYDLEVRIVRPAPFDDPRQAIQHALYDHIGQVDSWLTNRPRGASVERRIRDTGNLMGTSCMSCHTQSGVWGPAIPFAQGYRPQNVQLYRNLANICYQSMRPTNELIDAANNTSLRPLDLGDGPAGTRVTGHAVVSLERYQPARKLQSQQAIRAANFILQTNDPGGINAAGPGANVGQSVVFNYAGEVLWSAWRATGDPKYFRALEDKARKMLTVNPKYTDDMCHRVEFFSRFFPDNYPEAAAEVARREQEHPDQTTRVPYEGKKTTPEEAQELWDRIQQQIQEDIARIRAIQNEDGTWGFNPGRKSDDGTGWVRGDDNKPEPSPTALALIALEAAGFNTDDPIVDRGVKALLKLQHPTGLWKGASQTGFVSTSYCLHALSRLFPTDPPVYSREQFEAAEGESLAAAIRRVRDLSTTDDPNLVPLMVEAASHASPLVRYWAMIGLGATHTDEGVEPLIQGIGDPVKMVREAAHWGLRQTLIDDRGWEAVLKAAQSDDDYVRETAMRALVMRVDGVLPEISTDWDALTDLLATGMNEDPHPAVRAWATQAAWQWWVWNPPVRKAINDAWIDLISRPESNRIVENCIRYQSQALFIANGHKANGSDQHQYKELAELFFDLQGVLEDAAIDDPELEDRIVRRLVGVAATFYNTAGGDGGPGQMGYVTPTSGELFGHAIMTYFKQFEADALDSGNLTLLKVGLEGAANIPHQELQQKLIDYSLNGPEELRPIAANSVSDPRSAQLVAVPELVEPLMQQVHRGANEPPRRPQLSDPVLSLFGRVRWVIPQTREQQDQVLDYLIPEFDRFYTAEELAGIPDATQRAELTRKMDADWYLASGLGDAIGSNEDLHFDTVLERFPESFENPLTARFWLPSVSWLLTYKTMLPEVKLDPGEVPPADPLEELRTRALQLFLDQLAEVAEPRTRELAVKMAQDTALRRNPEVLNALEALLEFDTREHVVNMAKNVLSTSRQNFEKELVDAVKQEQPRRFELGDNDDPVLPREFVEDFVYFRDYVNPELNRVLRGDQRSCFACHGVPGRVPPLTLKRPDDAGYLPVADLLANYRLLQERIDFGNVDKSKLLRKPLNVQTGEEDGHQGGRRYQPDDPGYQILRRWVANQVQNPDKLGIDPETVGGP